MFSKKKRGDASTITPASEPKHSNFIPSTDRNNHCTVIAKGTEFTGNIEVENDIQVYGKIVGNISVKEGSIHIMHAGRVEGVLEAQEITVDGVIEGTSIAHFIEILEHGEFRGAIRCSSLSIRRGGIFIGQSEWLDDLIDGCPSRVVEFKHSSEFKNNDDLMSMNNTKYQP